MSGELDVILVIATVVVEPWPDSSLEFAGYLVLDGLGMHFSHHDLLLDIQPWRPRAFALGARVWEATQQEINGRYRFRIPVEVHARMALGDNELVSEVARVMSAALRDVGLKQGRFEVSVERA